MFRKIETKLKDNYTQTATSSANATTNITNMYRLFMMFQEHLKNTLPI